MSVNISFNPTIMALPSTQTIIPAAHLRSIGIYTNNC